MWAFLIIGLVLNLIGTGLAGSALYEDWKHFGHGDLWPWLARARRWVRSNVLRRRSAVHVVTGAASLTLSATAGTVFGRNIVSAEAPVDEQIAYLRREVDSLYARINAQHEDVTRRIHAVQTSADTANREARDAISAVEKLTRQIATGTVRRELLGLVLIGAGSILSVVPALPGWT